MAARAQRGKATRSTVVRRKRIAAAAAAALPRVSLLLLLHKLAAAAAQAGSVTLKLTTPLLVILILWVEPRAEAPMGQAAALQVVRARLVAWLWRQSFNKGVLC
jgi:hypothetical protein